MGTGGTLPTNITQSVTLYNTTGVIEKDKGIYFCPFIRANLPIPVYQRWHSLFTNVVNAHDNYKNIPISQWSPQDRSLTIKGNVDDFRLITEEGNSFNYLIVIRNVKTNNVTVPHFYAFFITNVQQVGNGSVRLELEPDDFTNVFYLHNRKRCNQYSGYYVDVFNERMKNCYVARQHYNRVKETAKPLSYEDNDVGYEGNPTVIDINLYSEITELSNYRGKLDITNISLHDVSHHFDITDDITKQELMLTENGYVLHLELAYYFQDEQLSINLQLQSYYAEEDNLPIFSQIEEGFKYKRQYRDYKEFINYGNPLTEEEKQAYEEAESWEDLTEELQVKAYELSIAFMEITFRDNEVTLAELFSTGGRNRKDNVITKVYPVFTNQLTTLVYPVMILPEYLKKFESLMKIHFSWYDSVIKVNKAGNIYTLRNVHFNPAHLQSILSNNSPYASYIVSAFISKENYLKNEMKIKTGTSVLGNYYYYEFNLEDENFILLLGRSSNNPIDVAELTKVVDGTYYYDQPLDDYGNITIHASLPSGYYFSVGFVNKNKTISFSLNLDDSKVSKDLKTEYFDTVLTFNPYSFYSVSYLGRIEVPLNKLNYYENPLIKCDLTIVCSDIFKYSFLPTYQINGKDFKMYSESIEQSLSNSLTIVSSALNEYIISNQSQMRNQYAVNDVNHGYGLVTSAISGVGNTVGNIMKGALIGGPALAGAGAIAGAVQTVTGLVTEGIDWDKDSKLIEMNQKAKLADMGNLPSNLKQVGTDINIDLAINELGLYLNHYTIDELSYNSICKYLERFGYVVNIYDSLNVNTRKGWDFVQLKSFDYEAQITVEQEEKIRQIFANGVTLLHDKSFMVSGHNYEIILD